MGKKRSKKKNQHKKSGAALRSDVNKQKNNAAEEAVKEKATEAVTEEKITEAAAEVTVTEVSAEGTVISAAKEEAKKQPSEKAEIKAKAAKNKKAKKNEAEIKSEKGEKSQKSEKSEKIKNGTVKYEEITLKVKSFIKTLPERYKNWLYKDPSDEKEKRTSFAPSVAAALVIPVLLFVFALYYAGILDVSFIPRPEAWENNAEKFFSIGKTEEVPEETKPVETEPAEEEEDLWFDRVPSVDLKDTVTSNRNELQYAERVFNTSDELYAEGYYVTDATYNAENCVIGKMTYSFELPDKYCYRNMTVRDYVITEYDDGRMSTCEETETETQRPALYPYMGYIIMDDAGKELYLLDYTGNVLMKYNEKYIPAFARTKDGKPLFYTTYKYYAETPASVETNEAGEEIVTDKKAVYLTGKKYYTLSASGTYFVETDYVEERDGRGLTFDFTDTYGLPEKKTKLKRVGVMSPKFTTFLNGKSALVNFMNWNFFLEDDPEIPVLEDIIAKENEYNALSIEEKLALIEEEQTPQDLYGLDELLPYSLAYNYSEGYAVVETDDTGEEPKYETKELRVINPAGEVQFVSRKNYYNKELKDYCSDRFLSPLSKGADSIGHYYFDHGLLRLRKVSFDQYQLDEWGVLRVNMDRDVLVYPNGKEFPIPDGYTLKGYSDGILVLERNGLYGYMDNTGRWIAEPVYTNAEPFYQGLGVVTKNGNKGVVDTNGNFVLPLRYFYISNRSDGIITAYSGGSWDVYGVFTK